MRWYKTSAKLVVTRLSLLEPYDPFFGVRIPFESNTPLLRLLVLDKLPCCGIPESTGHVLAGPIPENLELTRQDDSRVR